MAGVVAEFNQLFVWFNNHFV